MTSYKESVIIPLSLFQRCKLLDTEENVLESLHPDHKLKLIQQERLQKIKPREPAIEQDLFPHENNVIESVGVKDVPFVHAIIDLLKPKSDEIHWNKNYELILDDKVIPGTHVIDLFQFIMKNKIITKASDIPLHGLPFYYKLQTLGVPESWIKVSFPRVSSRKRPREEELLGESPKRTREQRGSGAWVSW